MVHFLINWLRKYIVVSMCILNSLLLEKSLVSEIAFKKNMRLPIRRIVPFLRRRPNESLRSRPLPSPSVLLVDGIPLQAFTCGVLFTDVQSFNVANYFHLGRLWVLHMASI